MGAQRETGAGRFQTWGQQGGRQAVGAAGDSGQCDWPLDTLPIPPPTHPEAEVAAQEDEEAQGDDGEAGVGAHHAVADDGEEVAKEVLLLDRQAGVKDDGRQEEPAGGYPSLFAPLRCSCQRFASPPAAPTTPGAS